MRDYLMRKNGVNLVVALSLAILPAMLLSGKSMAHKDGHKTSLPAQIVAADLLGGRAAQ